MVRRRCCRTLTLLVAATWVAACRDGDGTGPERTPPSFEGVYDLADLNGTPPPVVALSTPEGAIRILWATLEVTADSLFYTEHSEQGPRLADGSIDWQPPVTVRLSGWHERENAGLLVFIVQGDAILVLEAHEAPGELTIVVPADHGIPERRLRFRHRDAT